MANVNKWSKTAGSNATADSDINWAEGQAPSTVNNSARFMMQGDANDRDDTRGALTTGGTTTAYTITTNSINTSLQAGLEVWAKINATSTGSVTLNVDGLGAKKCYDNGSGAGVQIGSGGLTIGEHAGFQYDTALDAAAGGWVKISNPGAASTSGFATTTGGAWAAEPTAIASAATTDILGASAYFVAISGTATITSLGSGINRFRMVRATGAFTLTHNATSLILPTGANIVAVSGDTFLVESDASSNCRVYAYQRTDGRSIKAFTGDSGSGGIIGLVPAPSSGDAAAGKFLKADGTFAVPASTSKVAQVVTTQVTALSAAGSTLIPYDDTIPQNTEGDQYMTLAITPTNASSTLVISVNAYLTSSSIATLSLALFQDSTASALAATAYTTAATSSGGPLCLTHTMTAGTTSATTFKFRAGPSAASNVYMNGVGAARKFGGVAASTITITEITP